MGAGKSFLGQQLAKDLGYNFVDLDVIIEKKEASSITTIFEKKGEAYFRKLEQQCLWETALLSNTIIALGGGTPCFENNMDWIKHNGISFFLDVSLEVLVQRLSNETQKRPLLKDKNQQELGLFIAQKLEERYPSYNQATYILKDSEQTLTTIKTILQNAQ